MNEPHRPSAGRVNPLLVPLGIGGWVWSGVWLHTETVTHPSTNRARRSATSTIRPTHMNVYHYVKPATKGGIAVTSHLWRHGADEWNPIDEPRWWPGRSSWLAGVYGRHAARAAVQLRVRARHAVVCRTRRHAQQVPLAVVMVTGLGFGRFQVAAGQPACRAERSAAVTDRRPMSEVTATQNEVGRQSNWGCSYAPFQASTQWDYLGPSSNHFRVMLSLAVCLMLVSSQTTSRDNDSSQAGPQRRLGLASRHLSSE